MSRYENALKEARRVLGEADGQNPQLDSLKKQKVSLQNRIAQIDKQREPLVLQLQDLNKKITLLGGVVDV